MSELGRKRRKGSRDVEVVAQKKLADSLSATVLRFLNEHPSPLLLSVLSIGIRTHRRGNSGTWI